MTGESLQGPTFGRKALGHLAGAVAYILLAIIGMMAYGMFYKATGPKVDGMVGGAIIVFLPVAMFTFGLIVWTPAWIYFSRKWKSLSMKQALGIAAVLSTLAIIFYCQGGLGCFLPGRSEHMIGWFFVFFASLGAATHNNLYRRITRT